MDLAAITPKPNNWFLTTIEYLGQGHAEFLDPVGSAEGPTSIYVDEQGDYRIMMRVVNYASAEQLHFGLKELLSGIRAVQNSNGSYQHGIGTSRNKCLRLTVKCASGVFTSDNVYHFADQELESKQIQIQFFANHAQFDSLQSRPKYWVLPLSNFVSEFRDSFPELDQHPLRIYPTPIVPSELPENDVFYANLVANEKNKLIAFLYAHQAGFIERLPDYKERVANLQEGHTQNILTALMIGQIGGNSIEYSDLSQWFPADFLLLLGLATGSEVGAPWIEFRDRTGRLIRRIHRNFGKPFYIKGHQAIVEGASDGGIGYLLSRATKSVEFGGSRLHVTLKQLIRSSLQNRSIEDQLTYLFRALDGLCEHYQVNVTSLLLELSPATQKQVVQIRNTAAQELRELARASRALGTRAGNDEATILDRVEGRINNSTNQDEKFGRAVVKLLERFELRDAVVIDRRLRKFPGPNGIKKWDALLSYYRTETLHFGYFDVLSGTHDIDDLIRFTDHLRDVVIRIVLKMIRYDAAYHPAIPRTPPNIPVNWVKARGLPAARLGY
jgi:hypothetical protein